MSVLKTKDPVTGEWKPVVGGGSSTMTVTIDEEAGMASHTSVEIYAHVQSGGTAVLNEDGYVVSLVTADTAYAYFGYFTAEENIAYTWLIYDDGVVEFYEQGYAPHGMVVYNPSTAKVGQTIVVRSVDANGRPTAWECVDLPSGGSSTLTVAIDQDGKATHTVAEIYAHMQSGGTAELVNSSGFHYVCSNYSDGSVYFTFVSAEEGYISQYGIYDGNNVDFFESEYVSYDAVESTVESLIDEKLAQIPIAEEATF